MQRSWPVLLLISLAACGLPQDPEETLGRIMATHELRVGLTENEEWVKSSLAEPQGIEPDVIRQFAARIGAEVIWSRGSEAALAQGLKRHEIDLAAGGFDAKTPWKSIAGVSQPFAETGGKKHVLLTAPGENRFILVLDTFLTKHLRDSKAKSA